MPERTTKADQRIEALARMCVQVDEAVLGDDSRPPEAHPQPTAPKVPFRPKLNPRQAEVYDSNAKFILAHGERGSGKTIGALHKLVRHCYENDNALALVVTGVKRQAEEGGAWHKLQYMVLPQWGQLVNERTLEIKSQGDPGYNVDGPLFFTDAKSNLAKDTFIWVSTKNGGWSRILLLSMPVEGFIGDRFRGLEPSYILVDEAQTLVGDAYFKIIIQQLGRRPGVKRQQAVYCANPRGPSHWLYTRFFINPVEEGGKGWNPEYATIHVPIKENIANLPPGYYENVLEAVRGDDIEFRRMVLGEWVDAPEGDTLFADLFDVAIHVRGTLKDGTGILPTTGAPIILGWDPGAAHTVVTFQQLLVTVEKVLWTVIDELHFVDRFVPFFRLAPIVVDRKIWWCKAMGHEFRFLDISDSSAFNQFRAREGSFDYQDLELFTAQYVDRKKLDARYKLKMLEAPKGNHSIETRVRALREKLEQEEILISARCIKTIDMLNRLEHDPKNRMRPNDRSPHTHVFDSLTYPHIYYSSRRSIPAAQLGRQTQIYQVGRGGI